MSLYRTSTRGPARRGAVAPTVAVLLIALLGFAAIVLEGGLLMDDHRSVQAAADAGALAGATALFKGKTQAQATESGSTTTTAILNNFYPTGSVSMTITCYPGLYQAGPNAGKQLPSGGCEVLVTYYRQRTFSQIFGSSTLAVNARAVANSLNVPSHMGVLLLNPTAQGALTMTGSATINVDGSVIVDSNSSKAAVASGSAGLNSTELDITGSYSSSSSVGFLSQTLKTGQTATADPLATLPVPDPSTMTVQSTSTYKPVSGETVQPGVYNGGISISSQPNVTFAPGIFYLKGGGLVMSGGSSSLTANQVMIYNGANSSGQIGYITLSGGGTVVMSPPTSGVYQGMAIFQDRTSTNKLTLSGGSTWGFTGTVYAAAAHVDVSGGSGAAMGSQYISDTLTLSGSSTFQDIDPSKGHPLLYIGLIE